MYDISQIPKPNYDEIFDDVLKKDPEQRRLIEYIRKIPNLTQKEYKQVLLDIKSDNQEILHSAFSRLMNHYMKVAINIAYKFSTKQSTPLDETIQYSFEELAQLCNDYIEKNRTNYNNSHIINPYGHLYNYIYQRILRRLESEKFNLLNIPNQETINSILKNREKNLQEQLEILEKNNFQEVKESVLLLKGEILLLQEQLQTLKDLESNLKIKYRQAFEKEFSMQKKWNLFYDFSKIKECATLILDEYNQTLMQFNMTKVGIVRKIKYSEFIYTSCDFNSIINELIAILNEKIYKLIHITEERIHRAEYKINDIVLNERKQAERKIVALKREIRLYTELSLPPYSMEMIVEDEQEANFGLCDESLDSDENLDSIVMCHLLQEQLNSVLRTLTVREAKVLRLSFGLEDGRIYTLEEIARIFDVNRERIRQIEAKALRKLRHPSRSKILKDYLD